MYIERAGDAPPCAAAGAAWQVPSVLTVTDPGSVAKSWSSRAMESEEEAGAAEWLLPLSLPQSPDHSGSGLCDPRDATCVRKRRGL